MQDKIPDALIDAFERHYAFPWDEPTLRNERLAWRTAWAEATKPCLLKIQEPATPQAAPAAVAVPDERWCPDVCPITGRRFFGWIEHWKTGQDVPTYGGPFDSYTIPVKDEDGTFSCERFDHDAGEWMTEGMGWCCLGLMLADDQAFVVQPGNPRYDEIRDFAEGRAALAATPAAAYGPARLVESSDVVSDCGGIKVTRLNLSEEARRALSCNASEIPAAAAPVVLPEPAAAPMTEPEKSASFEAWAKAEGGPFALHNCGPYNRDAMKLAGMAWHASALLAGVSAPAAQAVEHAPVLYVSKGQLDNFSDPNGPDSTAHGRYLPARVTPAGKLTTPLFAAPQAQTDARDDSALLDAMERQRIAVVPEYEGPWDAEVYNDDGKPNHRYSGSTPREAIRAAIAAAEVSGGTPAHYLVDEHYPTEASERDAQTAQGGEA